MVSLVKGGKLLTRTAWKPSALYAPHLLASALAWRIASFLFFYINEALRNVRQRTVVKIIAAAGSVVRSIRSGRAGGIFQGLVGRRDRLPTYKEMLQFVEAFQRRRFRGERSTRPDSKGWSALELNPSIGKFAKVEISKIHPRTLLKRAHSSE